MCEVSCVWFLLLAGTGIYNITAHPGIFRAFDPSRAVMRKFCFSFAQMDRPTIETIVFVRTGDYDILAGVLLALTGCEAIFAKCVSVLLAKFVFN
jgi:KUP system potassium uptake protein